MRHYFHPLYHNNIIYFIVGMLGGVVLILLCAEIPLITALEKWQGLLGAAATIFAGYMALVSVYLPTIWQSQALLGVIKNQAARYADILRIASDKENMTGHELLAVWMTDRDIPDKIRQAVQMPEMMRLPNEQLFLLPLPVVQNYLDLDKHSDECKILTKNAEFETSEQAQRCLDLFCAMEQMCRQIADYKS